MDAIKSLLLSRSDEALAYVKKISKDNFVANQKSIGALKRLTQENKSLRFAKIFLEEISNTKDFAQIKTIFAYFLFLNWVPFSEISALNELMSTQSPFLLDKEVDFFEDRAALRNYSFNRQFLKFVKDYAENSSTIYCLKNCSVSPKAYSRNIINGSIGFEGLMYIMQRFRPSLLFLESLFEAMGRSRDAQAVVYKFIIEAVVSQLIEEYNFCKAIMKEMINEMLNQTDSVLMISFLAFFEEFVWKNRKISEMYDKRDNFFRENLIRFPAIFCFDEIVMKIFNDLLVSRNFEVSHFKSQIKKLKKHDVAVLSMEYFKSQGQVELYLSRNGPIFSEKTMFSFLDLETSMGRVLGMKRRGTFTA